MAQASLAFCDWNFDVERGPGWLFVRPHRLTPTTAASLEFAEQVWALLERHLTHRLVLELDDIGQLDSHLLGQLVQLYERVQAHHGLMRVCELSPPNEDVLRACRLQRHFPRYRNRGDAVMGHSHPKQPR